MNRFKSIILGTFLATISVVSFSQNAKAIVLVVGHDHVDRDAVIARYDRDRIQQERRERLERERIERERREREHHHWERDHHY